MPIYPCLIVVMVIISPLVYGLLYLAIRYVENPGIKIGKLLSTKWIKPSSGPNSAQ